MGNMVPNLDAMSEDELWEFWQRYTRPTRKDAEELIGDRRKGYTILANYLAGYASNKATAMMCRRAGDISSAEIYEEICELMYNKLPEDLRW